MRRPRHGRENSAVEDGTHEAIANDAPLSPISPTYSDCEQWTGHVIVFGLQGVGLRTVEQLRVAEVPVVVLNDPDVRLATLVESWGCPHMSSDGDPATLLRAAGLAGARAVVCTQASDLRNVEIALLALPDYVLSRDR